MTFVKFKAQAPLQKTVTFTNKVMELGDSYIQRRTTEKVTTVYSVTSEPLTKKDRDYYEQLFNEQSSILWQPYEGIALSYFKAINYSFEQVTPTLFLLKAELESMQEDICIRLFEQMQSETSTNAYYLEEAWKFIFKYTSGAYPKIATALFQAVRHFEPPAGITNISQILDFQLTTSKDYYLFFEAILDLYLLQNNPQQIQYLITAIEEYYYNPLYLYGDVPDPATNTHPFWLPNATYTGDDATPNEFFSEENVRASGVIGANRQFVNGVSNTPITKLAKAVKVYSGNLQLNRLDSPLQTGGVDYLIDYFIDENNYVVFPDGLRVNNTFQYGLHPKGTIVLRNKTINATLKVNYNIYANVQTTLSKAYHPYPTPSPVFGIDFFYYGYTSYFILNFYQRIVKEAINFRLTRSLKSLEYTLPFVYNNINQNGESLPYTPGIAPTYVYIQHDSNNLKYPNWYGYYYVFEQNENFWRLLANKTLEANNVLAFKLAAMDDYKTVNQNNCDWLFSPIYTPIRNNEPTTTPNQFIHRDIHAGVDKCYSVESQYQIIANTAEYLFHNPLNETAQIIVNRWINGIFAWFEFEQNQQRFSHRPPSFFYPPTSTDFQTGEVFVNVRPAAGFEESPYSAAMILKIAVYANLAGINLTKTIWLILAMNKYLINQFTNEGLMKGSWTKNQKNAFIVNNITQNVYKDLKNEHHFEIIRALCLLEKAKPNLRYPGCASFDTSTVNLTL